MNLLTYIRLFVDVCHGTDSFRRQYRKSTMDADEDEVVCIEEEYEYGAISGIDTETTESEQCAVEDAGPELGTEEEDGAAAYELEMVQDKEDKDDEGADDEKDDGSMVVMDERHNDDNGTHQKSTADEGIDLFL